MTLKIQTQLHLKHEASGPALQIASFSISTSSAAYIFFTKWFPITCHTQILSNIHKMRICFWKAQFESMAQDFGDQAFRDCWLFPRIFPNPTASFHLPIIWLAISDVTRITQACQCLYPLWRSLLRCTFLIFPHWALTSRPDKVFISYPAAPSHRAHLHILTVRHPLTTSIWSPPIKTTNEK